MEVDTKDIQRTGTQIRNDIAELNLGIEDLNSDIEKLSTTGVEVDLSPIQSELSLLQQGLGTNQQVLFEVARMTDGLGGQVTALSDKIDSTVEELTNPSRAFDTPAENPFVGGVFSDEIATIETEIEDLESQILAKISDSPINMGQMEFNTGNYTNESFVITRGGQNITVGFNLFDALGGNVNLIKNHYLVSGLTHCSHYHHDLWETQLMEFIYTALQYLSDVFGSIGDFITSIPDLINEVFAYGWYWAIKIWLYFKLQSIEIAYQVAQMFLSDYEVYSVLNGAFNALSPNMRAACYGLGLLMRFVSSSMHCPPHSCLELWGGDMAVYFRHGSNGAYKTAYAVWFEIVPALRAGRLVVTNIEGMKPLEEIEKILDEKFPVGAQLVRLFSRDEAMVELWQYWFCWMPTGALVIIDECQDIFTADVGFQERENPTKTDR